VNIKTYENSAHNQRKNYETAVARWHIHPWKLLEIPILQDRLCDLYILWFLEALPEHRRSLIMDFSKIKVYPIAERKSLSKLEDILVPLNAPLRDCDPLLEASVYQCVADIKAARAKGKAVILMFGAHLIKNGCQNFVNELVRQGWLTHLATNGAASIHDWELAHYGYTEESVKDGIAQGNFGMWDETGRWVMYALKSYGYAGVGYGDSLAQYIFDEGYEYRKSSIFFTAAAYGSKITVHPGIGYDIIVNHPDYDGAVVGRAAHIDYKLFCDSVDNLDDGVVLSVGSAIMAPQVFEKAISAVNNVRLNTGRPIVKGHKIYVVDIQDGGNWDWSQGEPPKDNPAYYLRFCKSFSRVGGDMKYLQVDNVAFMQRLYRGLNDL
jgi:hypothetical protein